MTHSGALTTDLAMMRAVADDTVTRSDEIRAELGSFIGRMTSVPATVWSGQAAVRFREVVEAWNTESGRLCHALNRIADTMRANERALSEVADRHAGRIAATGFELRG